MRGDALVAAGRSPREGVFRGRFDGAPQLLHRITEIAIDASTVPVAS